MHQTKLHIHEFLLDYFRNKELDELYLSVFLKSFAQSFISIFVPIYFLSIGYTFFDITLYYLIYYASISFIMPFTRILNSKLGVKKTMALGIFTLIFYYFCLNYLQYGLSYYPVALIYAISVSLYFSAFHLEFTRSAIKKEEGKEVSIIKAIPIISAILGPLIGSLFIAKTSFTFLFGLVSVILFFSIIPLFFSKDFKVPLNKFSFKRVLRMGSTRKAVAYQSTGVLNIVSVIFWPLFIYLTMKDIVSLGAIVSMTSFLTIFIIIYIGRLADKDNKKALKFGVYSHAPSWILRIFLLSPFGLFVSNFFSSATSSILDISFKKIIYAKARKTKYIVDYFLFREFNLELGRVLILLAAIFTNSIYWMFIISFFVTFFHLVLLKEME